MFFAFTNETLLAKSLDQSPQVDTIFVDLEINGKAERQKGKNTLISKHTFEDIKKIRKIVCKSSLGVRVNPFYSGSDLEISRAINEGADVIMLPMFKNIFEVNKLLEIIDDKCSLDLLVETPEALKFLDQIPFKKIRYIHFGINDLSLALKKNNMFEIFFEKEFQKACGFLYSKKILFGIGGIGAMGHKLIPPELILAANLYLHSERLILSRSFLSAIDKSNQIISIKSAQNLIDELIQEKEKIINLKENELKFMLEKLKYKLDSLY